MLGRTASSLYWMSRSMERAENMARLLEVGYRVSLMPGAIEGHRDEWRSTLQSAACSSAYDAKFEEITAAKVIGFLIFDEDNPSSIRSSIKSARNNGRAVRTALSRDVWESINSTWNELTQIKPSSITADRLPLFLDWIKQRVMSFRPATWPPAWPLRLATEDRAGRPSRLRPDQSPTSTADRNRVLHNVHRPNRSGRKPTYRRFCDADPARCTWDENNESHERV